MSENTNPWISWHLGPCPVPVGSVVSLKFRNNVISNPVTIGSGKSILWNQAFSIRTGKRVGPKILDIIAYRIESLPKEEPDGTPNNTKQP